MIHFAVEAHPPIGLNRMVIYIVEIRTWPYTY